MRHKIKIVVGCVLIITGFLATNIAVGQLTSLQNDTRIKCSGIVIDGGEKTVGRCDNEYKLAEKYETDAEIYEDIQDNQFSTPIIETMINDGYLLGYVDQLKAEGWIPQDFTPAGSKTSNTSSAEAKTETPAETPNETSTSDNKQPEKTEKTISLKQRQRQRKSQHRKKLMQHGKKQREWKQPVQRMVRLFIPIPLLETQKKNLSLQLVMIMK